jgi:predicted MFS family arabinose efflux permease
MTASTSSVNYRLLLPLMAHGVVTQIMAGLFRITTSYRVLELGLPVEWIGVVATSFAIFPIFLAVQVGRYIDRNHDADALRIGSVLCVIAAIGLLYIAATPLVIMCFMVVAGVGHLFLMASHQMLCVRAAGEKSRDSVFGNFLMVTGIGQGLGPFIVGWVGGDARVPDTWTLYVIALVSAVTIVAISLFIAPDRHAPQRNRNEAPMSLGTLLRINGFVTVLIASVITMSAQDLIVVYLPLLGNERNIGVSDIGWMLTVRSITAVISRIGYSQLVAVVGRVRLTFITMALSGVAFIIMALPVSISVLYVACAVLGLGLGLASALSLTSVVELAPPAARGTALSLRITGNRIGQASIPSLGSLVVAAAGAAGVLGLIGLALIVSGISVQVVRGRKAS